MFRETSISEGLWVITIRDTHVAGLAAIRAIVKPVHTETNPLLRLAETTVLLAVTLPFGLIALRTSYRH